METIELSVDGLTCGSCMQAVKRALSQVPGVESADVRLQDGAATVRGDRVAARADALVVALTEAGYTARVAPTTGAAKPSTAAGGCGTGRSGRAVRRPVACVHSSARSLLKGLHPKLMEISMTRRLLAIAGVAAFAAMIALGGCAVQTPAPTEGIEQKIASASTRADHEAIAEQYERQASRDAAAAKRHYGYAAVYRRNTSPRSAPQAHEAMARHCDALARTYEEAAAQNLAMAKLHRSMP